jgi:hypothetical protein
MISAPLANNHVIVPHTTNVTWPSPTFSNQFRLFPSTFSDFQWFLFLDDVSHLVSTLQHPQKFYNSVCSFWDHWNIKLQGHITIASAQHHHGNSDISQRSHNHVTGVIGQILKFHTIYILPCTYQKKSRTFLLVSEPHYDSDLRSQTSYFVFPPQYHVFC